MTKDKYKEFIAYTETDEGAEAFFQPPKIDMNTHKAMLQSAFDALCALREVGKFFDEHDGETSALTMLLSSGMIVGASPDEIARVQEVQKELGIPVLLNVQDL